MRKALLAAALVAAMIAATPGAAAAGPAAGSSEIPVLTIVDLRNAYDGAVSLTFAVSDSTRPIPIDSAAVASAYGLDRIDLLVDGKVVGTASGDSWRVAWDTSTVPDKRVDLVIRGYNADNASRDFERWTYVDHTGPALKLMLQYDVVSGQSTDNGRIILFEVSDEASGVDRVELYGNGQLLDWETGIINPHLHWKLNAPHGSHVELSLRAYDGLGHVSEVRRTLLVDNEKPVVTVQPANRAFVRGVIHPSVTSFRDLSGIAEVALNVSSRIQFQKYVAPWRFAWDTRKLSDGTQVLTWNVYDQALHVTVVQRLVTVDNHLPTVSYRSAPKNGVKLTKTVTIAATAGDAHGVSRVQLLVNGKVAATDYQRAYSFRLNPKKYGKKFTVRLRAYDRAGNVRYSPIRTYRR
jgi:hypothetical protein